MRADATFEHIGVLWWIEGDTDHDSAMTLDLNYRAASALFLHPGQTYELRLTLTDPDGGNATRTLTATTRAEPQADPAGRQLYVIPGSGGGDGSADNPFKGLQSARHLPPK